MSDSEQPASKMSVRGLEAWFGKQQVLKGIEMDVPARRVTAIIGPSGCGKSTFIRCLNRMHELVPGAGCKGEVKLDDADVYAPYPIDVVVDADGTIVYLSRTYEPDALAAAVESVLAGR